MKKRLLILGVLLLLLSQTLAIALAEPENILPNGGFEALSANGGAEGWYTSAYRTQEGYTRFDITADRAHSGTYSARITNANTNDARFVYALPVEPSAMYRVSGYVLVETMEDFGNGANIGIEGVFAFSQTVFDTAGKWQYIEWYGETGENQHSVELGVRVGGYGSESQGTAYFDDIRVEKVDTLPTGMIATLWYTVDAGDDAPAVQADSETNTPGSHALWFMLVGVAFGLLAALAGRALLDKHGHGKRGERPLLALLLAGMVFALLLRLYLGGAVAGYQVDMGCFSAWSLRMASEGPWGFYAPDFFCDYPPGYMLLLWPVGLVLQAVGYADTPTVRLIIKAIPLIVDMVAALLLFWYARKRIPLGAAVFVSLLFAINPATLVNGAAWGQVDTLLALLLMLAAIAAMDKRWRVALPVYVTAVLVKPQALLFAPVAGVCLLMCFWFADQKTRREQWRAVWQGLLLAAGAAALIVVPFSVQQSDPLWLIKRYSETLSSYHYAVLNTANWLYVLGGNWSPLAGDAGFQVISLPWLVPVGTGVALLLAGAWMAQLQTGFRTFWERACRLPGMLVHQDTAPGEARRDALAVVMLLFGLAFILSTWFGSTFLVYGTLWMIFAYGFALIGLLADRKADALPFYLSLMMLLVYVFGLKIHERYLFPVLLLLPLAYTRTRDRRLLWLSVGVGITTFVNTAIVLDNSLLFGSAQGHLNLDTLGLNIALGLLNVFLGGFGCYLAATGLKPTPARTVVQASMPRTNACYTTALLTPRDARLHLTMRDYLIMGVTMVLYGVLTFTNLGSTVAPQTAWVATSAAEQATFALPENSTFSMLYYAGVSYSDFSVAVSEDGVTFSEPYACQMREGLCYRWNYAVTTNDLGEGAVSYNDNNPSNILWLTGKYLRLNAESAGLNLWEIVLRDKGGDPIPLTLISHTGAKDVLETSKPPENLIDEQNTLSGEPGWYNGTYFDEIYHARTAYEHLHGQAPYETTHPPLGKLMMAAGIALFGMTPFGWRFAGALVGVLMLPALYLLAKQLMRRRDLATFAMMLFGFDLMHFTQTRIATIDSFPVLFIILSVLCMARYLMTDVFAVPDSTAPDTPARVLTRPFLRTLLPLLLSGLFMGLSIASKWIGLYSAVGLAVLFGVAVFRQFRCGLVAFDVDLTEALTPAQILRIRWARELTLKRILVTCLFCLLFFIAIPAVIYYVSYIPYLTPTGPVTLTRLIKAQESMFAYQSTPGLGMDHPFNSPWWQWPLILKPMWFSQDKFEPQGFASTIMCMGNPLIFYVGAVCMLAVFGMFVFKYLRVRGGLRYRQGDGDLTLTVLVIGFLAQYLPWVLVPRSMYMYHYFASVPFIILATTVVFSRSGHKRLRQWLMVAYVLMAAIFFILFFPYASGLLTPTWWLDWLKWFPKLYY
ncbi:MAG: phospholipid carrier-dependent glycosyltransferase [Candidatus Limiplasma sp.]|nr:phospholipid carrier-dependent glycosyltransferase [Candidatus Limiplasma sp.]